MIIVYLDMDGPLVDFDEFYNSHPTDMFATGDFKRLVMEEQIFTKLKPSVIFNDLMNMTKKYEILSSMIQFQILGSLGAPNGGDLAYAATKQKKRWLLEHDVKLQANFVIHKGLKKRFATPNAILFDDTTQNIWDFNEHYGTGIYCNVKEPTQSFDHLAYTIDEMLDNHGAIYYGK